ncbi:pyrroline-5-carboxylate reductase dimerization-domain-containing protein [Fusarium flagelliforme]|uniref:pyrroline-5-carboxylate reductase dimerization-domain-containing protein n=1 Tax=Fusarium flagelliforme TaxID=2675880 RepID=UPI001E8E7EBE|nr:pyrroline-5-carboxylate reductase dimerization-domain-containing protein [Fusarium flagelliforme]KAH7173139.1 pyrroline-5-carboxylate reductase dimerization-domain-containing protein [Fusarium flagelliforme]
MPCSTTKETTACTFIGGGVLARCIIDGLLDNKHDSDIVMRVTGRRPDHVKDLAARYPSLVVSLGNRVPILWDKPWHKLEKTPTAHVILICTQPWATRDVCEDIQYVYSRWHMHPKPTIVTMCPGITTSQLESWLPEGASIVRTMPNTPVAVRQGATAMFANKAATAQQVTLVADLFRSVSPQVSLVSQESGIDVAASISGSSPAYLFKLLSALVEAGVSHGLGPDTAAALVKQSGLGAAIQAIQDGRSLQSLIEDVCVPGGSTEKAMARLEQGAFSALVTAAVEKSLAANRAMGKDEMTKVQSHV